MVDCKLSCKLPSLSRGTSEFREGREHSSGEGTEFRIPYSAVHNILFDRQIPVTRKLDSDAGENPFASPRGVDGSSAVIKEPKPKPLELKQTTFPNALARWTLICAVSAAPSFAMGLGITNANPLSVTAMVVGVLAFSLAYAFLDISPRWRRWMSQTASRRAIMTVFGIRVGASIVFPIAMMNDLFVGAFSLSAVQAIIRAFGGPPADAGLGPFATLATTVLEGALLNVEILAVGLVFFAIFRSFEGGHTAADFDSGNESP